MVANSSTTVCSKCLQITAERQVEVVHGLEDLDIQEDQNAVFVCEVSVADVPGEWYKNGEEIHPTNTIKIRQEGQTLTHVIPGLHFYTFVTCVNLGVSA